MICECLELSVVGGVLCLTIFFNKHFDAALVCISVFKPAFLL